MSARNSYNDGRPAAGCHDGLSAEAIRAGIARARAPGRADPPVVVLRAAKSTNDEAKLLAAGGAPHGSLVVAGSQSEGRGQRGRGFFSPPGAGLYMSAILRPGVQAASAVHITAAAAVAVCRAVEGLTGFSPSIKWVNDVYLHGKKVCGILTESAVEPGAGPAAEPVFANNCGSLLYAVVGIGINVSARAEDFPPGLRGVAGSIYPDGRPPITRNALAAAVMGSLLDLCGAEGLASRGFMGEYRRRSCVVGREIEYVRGGVRGAGTAEGIDDCGRLLVRAAGAAGPVALDAGEVTITCSRAHLDQHI